MTEQEMLDQCRATYAELLAAAARIEAMEHTVLKIINELRVLLDAQSETNSD